ncbi:MAG: DHH family phosphoesterase [Nitriliruptoraceae bacterium]
MTHQASSSTDRTGPSGIAGAGAWSAALTPSDLAAARQRLATACEQGHTVVIAGHINPDGDALGSALALHLALSAAGARTLPTIGQEPLELEPALAALPGVADLVPASALPPAAAVDLLVTVDAASPGRLGTIAELLDAGVETLVLDHHARSTAFGATALVAPEAAATVQLVALLLDELALPWTTDVATCLYVGLVTDTGRFSYAATDSSAHLLAARLLAAGVDQAGWSQRLFETRRADDLTLLGRGLARAATVDDVALVYTHLTAEDLAAAPDGSTEGLIDLLRSADGAEVALTLRPSGDGTWRASLRSRGEADVGAVATALGGGGHRLAAGFDGRGSAAEIVAQVVDLLREA